jgi:hydrogenase maturation protein HypF
VLLKNRSVASDVFAAGGDLKNTFALARGRAVYLSGHFGDLEELDASKARKKAVQRLESLLRIRPTEAAADMHPDFYSVKDAMKRFEPEKVRPVQHHLAHILSVIAEHGLCGKVLGLAFDGTGYGTDGSFWGSEFLLCDAEDPLSFRRMGHLRPVRAVGRDASIKNAKQMASCYIFDAEERGLIWEDVENGEILDPQKHQMLKYILKGLDNSFVTSSMGRLFDAAAAILGICAVNSYEGECPIMLEKAAAEAEEKLRRGIYTAEQLDRIRDRAKLRFVLEKNDGVWIADAARMIADLKRAKDELVDRDALALEFHEAVVDMIVRTCENICRDLGESGESVTTVALSGGTFLNRIILSRVVSQLTDRGYDVYVNERVPSGDGGISLGQAYALTQ